MNAGIFDIYPKKRTHNKTIELLRREKNDPIYELDE